MSLEDLAEKNSNGKPELGVLKYPLIAAGVYVVGLSFYQLFDSIQGVYNSLN